MGKQTLGEISNSEGPELNKQAFKRLGGAALAAALLCGTAAASAGAQQQVTVVVNGQVMSFSQPPVMRNSRVFVPMRAIFERLGSTVAYANGNINAQGHGRSVHLTIGSTQASINGSPFTMDVAPFVIAGRTEVPLRFVSQALGASVNWNGTTRTVDISMANAPASQNYTPQPAVNQSFYLKNQHPASGGTVRNSHPRLHAQFSEPVNQSSLHVTVDGRDVTSQVYANANGFDVTPNWQLAAGSHHVAVTGTTQAGASFNTGWSFNTTAGGTANYVRALSPAPGSKVGSSFTLSGRTIPGSQVHIVASGQASTLGGLLQLGTGTFQTDTTADGSGHFSATIGLNAVSGGQVRVIITSTAPDGASIERQLVYSS